MSNSNAFYLNLVLILVIYLPNDLSLASESLQFSMVLLGWSLIHSLQWKYGVQSGSDFSLKDNFGKASATNKSVLI